MAYLERTTDVGESCRGRCVSRWLLLMAVSSGSIGCQLASSGDARDEGSSEVGDGSDDDADDDDADDDDADDDDADDDDADDDDDGDDDDDDHDDDDDNNDDDSDLVIPWSQDPPGDLEPGNVPQFVALTFDDNFGLESDSSFGGVRWIVEQLMAHDNPAGIGQVATFDGMPTQVSLYHTSDYLHAEGNRLAWVAAFERGHEAGDHTVLHLNGGSMDAGTDPCCTAQDWAQSQWEQEIGDCRHALTASTGIGADVADVVGFRAPFLAYNDAMYRALHDLGFVYDTTLRNCFGDDEDGTNCSWPYTLHEGSLDLEPVAQLFGVPTIDPVEGLIEVPVTTFVIPDDSLAAKYGFEPGLRQRVPTTMLYPNLYDSESFRITGMDYTILIEAGLSPIEMSAIMKYNLDLHLEGNRSPFVFVAHAHMYAFSTPDDNPDTPSQAVMEARQAGLEDFVAYALSKPDVRLRPSRDIVEWIRRPVALDG